MEPAYKDAMKHRAKAQALKRAYKDAKRRARANPSDDTLTAAYNEAKRRYKAASIPLAPGSAAPPPMARTISN